MENEVQNGWSREAFCVTFLEPFPVAPASFATFTALSALFADICASFPVTAATAG